MAEVLRFPAKIDKEWIVFKRDARAELLAVLSVEYAITGPAAEDLISGALERVKDDYFKSWEPRGEFPKDFYKNRLIPEFRRAWQEFLK